MAKEIKEKKSFFERLTGTVRMNGGDAPNEKHSEKNGARGNSIFPEGNDIWAPDATVEIDERDAELTVDVYQTADTIIVKSMIAGVHPDDLDINITRDMVTIRGSREEERVSREDDYFVKELYWGSFSRTITLPEEVDVDEAEAVEKHGLLILKLPKLDKKKQSKLKVKTI